MHWKRSLMKRSFGQCNYYRPVIAQFSICLSLKAGVTMKLPTTWEYRRVLLNRICRKPGGSYKRYYLKKTKYNKPGMQFENFDKRIKEAADHHHPAYEDNAWKRMEKLLNKHMPVEEENRRGIFLIILLFL